MPNSRKIYLNLGYRLSSTESPTSRVLGPISHPCDGGMVELMVSIDDPEAGGEKYTPEELAHFRLYAPLVNSTNTLIFSSAIPSPIEELHDDNFSTGMEFVGMLHNILKVGHYADPLGAPFESDSLHGHGQGRPASPMPVPADPSHHLTKVLVQRLGLQPHIPIYTIYFVSQVGEGQLSSAFRVWLSNRYEPGLSEASIFVFDNGRELLV